MTPVGDALKERLSHGFFGPLTLSFCIYHWRAWLYAFTGTKEAQARIDAIVGLLGPDSIWIPVVAAAAYVLLSGSLSVVVESINAFFETSTVNWKAEIRRRRDRTDPTVYARAQILVDRAYFELTRAIDEFEKMAGDHDNKYVEPIRTHLRATRRLLDPVKRNDRDEILIAGTERVDRPSRWRLRFWGRAES